MPYFAAAFARTDDGWSGQELDLDDLPDLEALGESLRELASDGPGPVVLLLEEDDEYVAVVRVDGGSGALDEPKVFLSDRRAVHTSDLAGVLYEDVQTTAAGDDTEQEGTRPVAEPVGDAGVLSDLGTSADELLELCAEEGLLPADVITGIAERAGFADELEQVREG